MTYAQAAQSLILQPSGITDMQIAGNTLADRVPNEVKYYDAQNRAYGFNLNRTDASEGWIASATDLARFLAHVDGLSSQTILSANALTVMSTGSVANPNMLVDGKSICITGFITVIFLVLVLHRPLPHKAAISIT